MHSLYSVICIYPKIFFYFKFRNLLQASYICKSMPTNYAVNLRPTWRALPCVTPPGLQRRRLIPAPLPDTSSLGRKVGAAGQWVDLPPLGGAMKEPFEIKVYEIDDVERLQGSKEGLTEVRVHCMLFLC